MAAEQARAEAAIGQLDAQQQAQYRDFKAAQERQAELEAAAATASGGKGAAAERQRLLTQIRDDTAATQAAEARGADLEAEVASLKAASALAGGEQDAAGSEKAAKYEELVRRDREMSAFLEGFEGALSAARARVEGTQRAILAAIERMKALQAAKDAKGATPAALRELQGDLRFKEREMAHASSTNAALQEGALAASLVRLC